MSERDYTADKQSLFLSRQRDLAVRDLRDRVIHRQVPVLVIEVKEKLVLQDNIFQNFDEMFGESERLRWRLEVGVEIHDLFGDVSLASRAIHTKYLLPAKRDKRNCKTCIV